MKQMLDSKWLNTILITVVGFMLAAAWSDIKANQHDSEVRMIAMERKITQLETTINLWDRYGQPPGPHDNPSRTP